MGNKSQIDVLNRFEAMLGFEQTKFILDVAEMIEAGSETVIAYTTTQRFRESLATVIRNLDAN